MLKNYSHLILSTVLLVNSFCTWAEDIYLDDKIMVGLHQDKSVDTPIIKLLPGGTKLELVKRDLPLSQVRDADGTFGWIDNNYLTDTPPGRAQLQIALEKIAGLEGELTNLRTTPATGVRPEDGQQASKLAQENEDLKQLLKSERLRVGELQAQSAELKNKLGQIPDNSKLVNQLQQLKQEKTELENRLDTLQSEKNTERKITIDMGALNWKKLLVYIASGLVIGFIFGLYLMDLLVRRRHGGFRI
jgi:uncharacterized protein YgiM (DUF1202 family)